ncbi:hypothetical protein Ddc_20302 [Ditylenchus destructor]|nr:hypothetical protein Ddc_20302 [Ditylenchus destructor]
MLFIMVERKKLPTEGFIEIFDKELSPEEEYNKWVIWNGYSKRVSGKRRTLYEGKVYQLNAYADYNAPNHRRAYTSTSVFHACVELNNRNWPFFQHFVRLLFDPFVYIRSLKLDLQNDVLNLLAGAMNTHHGRIQCRELTLKFGGNAQEFMSAVKDHVLCDEFHIWIEGDSIWVKEYGSNYDKEMLDLCNSGNHCASAICVKNYDLSTVIANLVQKFMDLKNCDECQVVDSIQGPTADTIVDVLKRNYAIFLVKEEMDKYHWTIEVKKMRRSARLAATQSKIANETRTEPKTKKSRSDYK